MVPLTLLGWLIGAIYFNIVARAALSAPEATSQIGFGRAISQSLVLSVTWLVIFLMIVVPIALVLLLLEAIIPLIANTLILVLATFGVWVILPVYFSPHGIFVRRQRAVESILGAIQLVRYTLPTSSLFVIGAFLISLVTNWLWMVPADDSWMLAIGIAGHGFVTSMLLASSFIYYRNMTEWLQAAFEKLRSKTPHLSQ
jgi:hypothetical protein